MISCGLVMDVDAESCFGENYLRNRTNGESVCPSASFHQHETASCVPDKEDLVNINDRQKDFWMLKWEFAKEISDHLNRSESFKSSSRSLRTSASCFLFDNDTDTSSRRECAAAEMEVINAAYDYHLKHTCSVLRKKLELAKAGFVDGEVNPTFNHR